MITEEAEKRTGSEERRSSDTKRISHVGILFCLPCSVYFLLPHSPLIALRNYFFPTSEAISCGHLRRWQI